MPEEVPLSQRLTVCTLLAINLSHVLDFVVLIPLGPKLMREFSISPAQFGLLVSSYTFVAAGSSLMSAQWIDRINRKTALLILLAGFLMSNAICVFSNSYTELMAGRVLAGAFGGVMNAVIYSYIGQVVPQSHRGRATGTLSMAFPLVSIAGIPLGLKIADYWGWRATFIFVVIMTIASIIASVFVLPSLEPEKKQQGRISIMKQLASVFSYPPHRWAAFATFTTVLGGFTIVPYIAPFLVNNGHIPEDQLFLMYLFGGLFSVFSSRGIGIWADRWTKTTVFPLLCLASIVAILLFTTMPVSGLLPVLSITTFAMVVMPGRFVCLMAWTTVITLPEKRGAFMSYVSTIRQLSVGIATLIGGVLVGEAENGRLTTFPKAGAFAISATIVLLLMMKKLATFEKRASALN